MHLSSTATACAFSLLTAVAGCGDDGGPEPIDAPAPDAAPGDAPRIDAAVDAAIDAPGPPTLNRCTLATAVDHTAPNAARRIMFPALSYEPPCMKIRVGQTVTWAGNFLSHPLRPGAIVGGMPMAQPGNPIPSDPISATATATFSAAGDYGYYCNNHYPAGMMGAIYVVP